MTLRELTPLLSGTTVCAGAVWVWGSSSVTFEGKSTFAGNRADYGGE